jgi:hypothetical protein
MNRQQRRASKFKRQQWDRNAVLSHPSAAINRLHLAQQYKPEDSARLELMARTSWQSLINGKGTEEDFDVLGGMINVGLVLAKDIDELVVDVFDRAILSMQTMQARYQRVGKFGADAQALQNVPEALDLLAQLYANITPLQATEALADSMAIMRRQMAVQPIGLSMEARHA